MNKIEVIKALNTLKNPYTSELIDFNQVEHNLELEADKVILDFKELGEEEEKNRLFNRAIIRLLKIDLGYKSVRLTHIKADQKVNESTSAINDNTKVVAIMSGKGGVGKSQVTVNLAREYAKQGKKVGIIDADIYGYSIPKIMELYGEPLVEEQKIVPLISKEKIEVVSTQYFIEDNANKAIVWRAPMLTKMMNHFFNDVKWNQELDYLFIDMPPGTGDVTLNLNKFVEEASAIIVTTASPDASHVAVRAGMLANDLNFNVLGVIENMSYYEHKGEKIAIFGTGGGKLVAEELNVELIGKIQIDHTMVKSSDDYKKIIERLESK